MSKINKNLPTTNAIINKTPKSSSQENIRAIDYSKAFCGRYLITSLLKIRENEKRV